MNALYDGLDSDFKEIVWEQNKHDQIEPENPVQYPRHRRPKDDVPLVHFNEFLDHRYPEQVREPQPIEEEYHEHVERDVVVYSNHRVERGVYKLGENQNYARAGSVYSRLVVQCLYEQGAARTNILKY